jgi:hypothetical protein
MVYHSDMTMRHCVVITALALSLPGCATTPAPPDTGGAIARLSQEELARLMPTPNPKLPLAEIVRLSKAGVGAQDIIAKIRETGSRYHLSASTMIGLHAEGVSADVLDYIQSAREQDMRDRVAEEIDERELRHAEELRREQERQRLPYYCDRWWPSYPGYGWSYPYPFRPFGGFYWQR